MQQFYKWTPMQKCDFMIVHECCFFERLLVKQEKDTNSW